MPTAEQWETARAMRVNGASLSEIARTIGVSRQAVAKQDRRRGWLNQTGEPLPTEGMEPKRAVVMNLRRGCSIKVAAEAAGLHPNTVGSWMRKDPNYNVECRAAISLYGVDRIDDLTRASKQGNVRATTLALERHESTREDFAPATQRESLSIILFSRDGDGPRAIPWPNVRQPPIDGTCTQITDGEEKQ